MSTLVKHNQQDQKQEFDYFRALASVASKGGTHNMSVDTLMNVMLTAKDLGISPMKAINGGFYVVNGKISMSTALMTDRIRKEGHSIKIPEWTSQKCVVIGVRKDNGDSVKFEFTMEDAQVAGLVNSATWKKFPKQMLYNRAMSTLARTLFSDVVGNAYSEDEKWDIMNVPADKRPLEDADQDIEVRSAAPELEESEKLSEEEVANLANLVNMLDEESRNNFILWIKKTYRSNNLLDIPKSGYEKCVISLNTKIKYINDKNKESAVA
jgi:hypothetical protein